MNYVLLACKACGRSIGVLADEVWPSPIQAPAPEHKTQMQTGIYRTIPGVYCSPNCWMDGPAKGAKP